VVDAGNGEVALHSKSHNRYIRLLGSGVMDASSHKAADQLPDGWDSERFTPVIVSYPESPTAVAISVVTIGSSGDNKKCVSHPTTVVFC